MKYQLIVRTEDPEYSENPQDYESTDSCADLMRVFCSQEHQPYSQPFVSIDVSLRTPAGQTADPQEGDPEQVNFDDEDGESAEVNEPVLEIFKMARIYGEHEIRLTQDVFDELEVISAGDYQNIVCKLAALKMSGAPFHEEMHHRICDLSEFKGQQRRDKIEEFIARAKNYSSLGYAEARIFRRLRTSDKEPE
jgi:hypothetical protein